MLKGLRAVKLKISLEEWDYCFYFSFFEVLDSDALRGHLKVLKGGPGVP